MPSPTAAPQRPLSRALRAFATGLAIALAAGPAVAKDTPFGVELIPANYPNSTGADVVESLKITAALGSHSSFIWHWSESQSLQPILDTIPQMRQYGLKSLVQIGAIFLRAPAPPTGYKQSFGDSFTRLKYLRDVEAIAKTKPDYIILATEINLLSRFNPAEFEQFRTLYTLAYQTVKRVSPGTAVGASFLYTVWFAEYFLDHNDVPAKLAPMDFIAFTTYPIDMIDEGFYPSVADIPPDWYGSARIPYPNKRIIFSEVGWPSKYGGTPESQADFVKNLPRLMSKVKPELVTWAVLHDMEFFGRQLLDAESTAFLEGLGVDIDALFAHFNGMGLFDGFGGPKPALYEAVKLDFTAPPP